MPDSQDAALRAHIQDLLYHYAQAHITTDYIAYTINETARLLGACLHLVSPNDPTSIAFTPSLPKTVAACFGVSGQLPEYTETSIVDPKILLFIKNRLHTCGNGNLKSEAVWAQEDSLGLRLPELPVLTIKAIKETPRFGLRHDRRANNLSVKHFGIDKVEDEQMEEPQIDLEEAICPRLRFDQETYQSINTLTRGILGLPSATHAVPTPLHRFLRNSSPIREVADTMDVPLFPRNDGTQQGNTPAASKSSKLCIASGASALSDLSSLLPKAPDDTGAEEDLYKQQMVIVNGWEAFDFSSPLIASTPSFGPSSSPQREVDELLLESPPRQSFLRDLLDARMDEIEFPRSKKAGNILPEISRIGEGQSLTTFLQTYNVAPSMAPRVVTSPKSQPSSPRTSITASLLGQIAESLDGTDSNKFDVIEPDSGQDIELERLLKTFINENAIAEDPMEFILNERLDNKESLLMDVPTLSYPPWASEDALPSRLHQFVAPRDTGPRDSASVDSASISRLLTAGFLKRLKGLKSFQDDLEWRPFEFGEREPSSEEVSRTEQSIQIDCLKALREDGLHQDRYTATLSELLSSVSVDEHVTHKASEAAWAADDFATLSAANAEDDCFVLTAAERRRIFKIPDPAPDDYSSEVELASPPVKRSRQSQDMLRPVDDSLRAPKHRSVRFGEHHWIRYEPVEETDDALDDSGVFLTDSQDSRTRKVHSPPIFGSLSYTAEGYLGADDDGDVIPDIDPVHAPLDNYSLPSHTGWSPAVRSSPLSTPDIPSPCTEPPVFTPSAVTEGHLTGANEPPRAQFSGTVHRKAHDFLDHLVDDLAMSVSARASPTTQSKVPSAGNLLRRFMSLRSRHAGPEREEVHGTPEGSQRPVPPTSKHPIVDIPSDLMDKFTLQPSPSSSGILDVHRYLASLELIQKRGLVQALRDNAIDLVEREHLDGADMILAADFAILLIPLRTLPAQTDTLSSAINSLSWRFLHVLVIFETFSSSAYIKSRSNDDEPSLNPFSPPVIKAVKKIKRHLAISEACEDKRPTATVYTAFPLSTEALARVVRMFGDVAYARDVTGGLLWGDRLWLEVDDEDTDELDLAAIDGMNVFSAAVILSTCSLDEFLDKTPQARLDEFGPVIGNERVGMFNRVIARRIEAMQLPSSSPPTTSVETSNSIAPAEDSPQDMVDAMIPNWVQT